MRAEDLIAYVYLNRVGSKRNAFYSFEDLKKFGDSRPRCDELLHVIPVLNRAVLAGGLIRANQVVEYVKTARAAA